MRTTRLFKLTTKWIRNVTLVTFVLLFAVFLFSHRGVREKWVANQQLAFVAQVQHQLDVNGEYAAPWWTGNALEDQPRLLLYNRVPKSGSEMLVLLLRWLQGYNNFKHVRLRNTIRRQLTSNEQKDFLKEIKHEMENQTVPLSFDRHVYFVDFTQFGEPMPVYINLLRDPVEKIISRFFYHHIGFSEKYQPTNNVSKQQWKTKFFEQCLGTGNILCTFITGTQHDLSIPYFCGHHPRCMILNDEWALEQAIINLEKYFPVVGILERVNETLTVLERRLPRFFSGVTRLFYDELLSPKMNKNMERPLRSEIDQQVVDKIKQNLTHEYRLYEYAVKRLNQQYQQTLVEVAQ